MTERASTTFNGPVLRAEIDRLSRTTVPRATAATRPAVITAAEVAALPAGQAIRTGSADAIVVVPLGSFTAVELELVEISRCYPLYDEAVPAAEGLADAYLKVPVVFDPAWAYISGFGTAVPSAVAALRSELSTDLFTSIGATSNDLQAPDVEYIDFGTETTILMVPAKSAPLMLVQVDPEASDPVPVAAAVIARWAGDAQRR